MKMRLRFKSLLTDSGWLDNAVVSLDAHGKIAEISAEDSTTADFINGYAIPGFRNSHSHAFQFAMAGLAENHSGDDDFWSWRETMYKLANSITPDDMRAIAAMLYSELARHGWTHVAEFHYLHHGLDGHPFTQPATFAEALCEAAEQSGIKLTLIPIFYQKGGFGKAPHDGQKRFISQTFDDYARLFEATRAVCASYSDARVGVGVHSLRAVETDDILRVINDLPNDVPFHLHIAEQVREVEDCVAHLGARPVEWMLGHVNLNRRFNLVHATHLTENETVRLAESGANVVLCPTTEGNLGDGIFPLRKFREFGGSWSLGTDSHVGIDPFEEIRLLDYGQRLTSHNRNTFGADAGRYALETTLRAGRNAVGESHPEVGFLSVGEPFDVAVIDAETPQLIDVEPAKRLSAIVYSGAKTIQTFVNGRTTNLNSDEIRRNFERVIKRLRAIRSRPL